MVPLAIYLGWRFGLRGWRTALLMVLPTFWFVDWPSWASHIGVDFAAATLLVAALFARPTMFSRILAASHLPLASVAMLVAVLSLTFNVPGIGGQGHSVGWSPTAFLVLSLFLIGSANLGRQGLVIVAGVVISGLVSLLIQGADAKYPISPVSPISVWNAVAGVLAYCLGLYLKRDIGDQAERKLGTNQIVQVIVIIIGMISLLTSLAVFSR
jgi:hypothetical protein